MIRPMTLWLDMRISVQVHTDIVQYTSKMAKRECKNQSSLFAFWTTSSRRTKMYMMPNEYEEGRRE